MSTGQPIEIPLSKLKLVKMLAGALAFVAIGLWFVINPPHIDNSYWGHPTKLAIVGYASIIFFGLCAVFLIRKLPDNKPGLILDSTGVYDNSGAMAVGQILWEDIEAISVLEMHKQKLLMVEVNNPQEYIDRQKSVLKRKGMALNYRMYGTPVSISANGLNMPFGELFALVTQRFREAKTKAEQRVASIHDL